MSILENQFGFMLRRSIMEDIHCTLIEHYRERKIDLHMVFIDLKKTYDTISRELLWRYSHK